MNGDEASVITPDGETINLDLSVRLDVEEIESLAIKETQVHTVPAMVLIVRKPDYLGSSMWDLRHGKRSISAKIEHEGWLNEFQRRRVDVRPGDALKCAVRIEMMYGHDNELINEKYYVETVTEVLENKYEQHGLPLQQGE